jgi:UDP-N-acetylmuramoyl-L-alanyl-D-glutamate--2,6-diaminopimelate ligase
MNSAMKSKQINEPHTKSLRWLLEGVALAASDVAVPDIHVSDLTLDSRVVTPGAVFIAVPGLRSHGLAFASQAIATGASVILYEPAANIKPPIANENLAVIAVPNLGKVVGAIADRFFNSPSAAMQVVGVTGTNGKTTSAYLLPASLAILGRPAGYAGTLGYGHIDALKVSAQTTGDCITVHRQLAAMRDAGDAYVGMEVSSHALDQGRIDAVRMHSALFTNLTRDHLDYHGTLEAYGAAKERLFKLTGLQHSVINAGDAFGREMIARLMKSGTHAQVTAYASTVAHRKLGNKQVFATRIEPTASGLRIAFDGSWGPGQLNSLLIGAFNAENLLGVLAVLLGLEVPLTQAVQALEHCTAPPGRMETFARIHKPTVVVDYAHTPDALSKALQTARGHTRGRLLCVFGCGGDRDAGKRPLMGAIAEQYADVVVLTDDNPRMEDADAIITDIQQGFDKPQAVIIERDRAMAIAYAIKISREQDLVLIAGKGHEDYQIVGRNVKRFSDREVALKCLECPS